MTNRQVLEHYFRSVHIGSKHHFITLRPKMLKILKYFKQKIKFIDQTATPL